MIQYRAVHSYKDVFREEVPQDPLYFVRAYPTEFILLRLSKVNSYLFSEADEKDTDLAILRNAIFAELGESTPDLANFEKFFTGTASVFSSQSISMMMAKCLENFVEADPAQLVDPLKFAKDLLRTIFIFNQLYFSRNPDKDLETFEGIFGIEVMQQNYFRKSISAELITYMRLAFLCKFLATHDFLKADMVSYCKQMEIGNPWIFAKFFLNVLHTSMDESNQGKHILDHSAYPAKLIEEFSMNSGAIKGGKVRINMDLVTKPFYLIEGEPMVLDFNFFHYAIEYGLPYSFYQNILSRKHKFKTFNEFQSYLGLHFFEKYLVGKCLHAIFFRRGQILVSTDKYQDFIVKGSSKDVYIFEVKMTSLHPSTLENLDFNGFKEYLKTNFLSSKSENGKAKGRLQIIKQIDNLIDDPLLTNQLQLKNMKSVNVYPVIICSDINVNLSGVNTFLNEGFDELLGERKRLFQSIKPLVIIHIEDLMESFRAFKNVTSGFKDQINAYLKNIEGLKKKYRSERGPFNYLLSQRSFGNFQNSKNDEKDISLIFKEMQESFDLDIRDFGK